MLVSALMFVFVMIGSGHMAFAKVGPDERGAYRPTIYINGEQQNLLALVAAIPPSGSTVVPFKEFFAILNIEPEFDNKTKTLTATSGETTITLTAGKKIATVNGKKVCLLTSPSLV
jgi:hypothetical protein